MHGLPARERREDTMNKTLIELNINDFPQEIRPYLEGATVYDSSCSDHARVYYSDFGFYIKVEDKGKLEVEAKAVEMFAQRHLGPEKVAYVSTDKDFLVTKEAVGEDCLLACYLEEPERLCKVLADAMNYLHSLPTKNEVQAQDGQTLATSASAGEMNPISKDESLPVSPCMKLYEEHGYGDKMKYDTFIHGDFCLPNIMLDDWKFSCFIDVGLAGVGDRHIDIYWALWSLNYNLKTDQYTDLFLDLYGREKVDMEILRLVAKVEKLG